MGCCFGTSRVEPVLADQLTHFDDFAGATARGFIGSEEQRAAVENHFGVTISDDPALWRDNAFSPFFSAGEGGGRRLLRVDTADFEASSAALAWLVRWLFRPSVEMFTTHNLEWFRTVPCCGASSKRQADGRAWPPGRIYRIHGYVDRQTRIARLSEWDEQGREIDVSQCSHASGGPSGSPQQFILYTATDVGEAHARMHLRSWDHPCAANPLSRAAESEGPHAIVRLCAGRPGFPTARYRPRYARIRERTRGKRLSCHPSVCWRAGLTTAGCLDGNMAL